MSCLRAGPAHDGNQESAGEAIFFLERFCGGLLRLLTRPIRPNQNRRTYSCRVSGDWRDYRDLDEVFTQNA
jgi:hypothetical protein